jgi:hypothetical protein
MYILLLYLTLFPSIKYDHVMVATVRQTPRLVVEPVPTVEPTRLLLPTRLPTPARRLR